MKIKKIQLKNGYKRFHDLTIDLGENPARIVALLGPNGCGKSSVFDGMLFLQNAHSQIGSEGRRGNEYHSMRSEASFPHSNVLIEFTTGMFEAIFQQKRTAGEENTIFSFRSSYRYNTALKVTRVQALEDITKNNYGASSASSIDQKMETNYRRLFAYYNNYIETNDCRPSEAKARIIGELNKSLKNCLDIRIQNLGNVEDNKGSLFFTKYDQTQPYEFDVLSSGEKEVVDILLDLYLRKDRYKDTIYIIDEPELHINTSIQKLLLLEIEKLVGENCQIWLATHSIGLMRALQTDLKEKCQVLHFEPGTNYATEQVTLQPIIKNYQTWRKIFHTALDDLTELVSPKRIIYCEGRDTPSRNQEKGFDARVYNTIFGEEFPDTLFVSSGGNTELDQRSDIAIKILSKVFSDLEVLVLKDRDFEADRETTKVDREKYLEENPDNHRVLMRKEIENYIFDKNILKKYCAQRGVNFDESEYDKAFSNIENDDVKGGIATIKKCCSVDANYGNEQFQFDLTACITNDTTTYADLKSVIFTDS